MLDSFLSTYALKMSHLYNFWADFLGGRRLDLGLDVFLRLHHTQQARTLPVELCESEGLVVHEELPFPHSLWQVQLQRGKAQLVLKLVEIDTRCLRVSPNIRGTFHYLRRDDHYHLVVLLALSFALVRLNLQGYHGLHFGDFM